MMKTEKFINFLLALSVFVVILGIIRFDWMAVSAEVLVILEVYLLKRRKVSFYLGFLKTAFIADLLLAILMAVDLSGLTSGRGIDHVGIIWVSQLLPLGILVFDLGLMIIVTLDRYTDSMVSRRWMIVFAMVFTFAFSGVYMFAVGFYISYSGLPFTNEDIQTYGRVTNYLLMAAPCSFCITGVVCGIVGRKILKQIPKEMYLVGVA